MDLSRKNGHKIKRISGSFFQILEVIDTLKQSADVLGYNKSQYI